jgi:phosphate:Na+ symporter
MLQAHSAWQAAAYLLGGLGLFLYGINVLSDALRQAAGIGLRRLIARGTRSGINSVGAGAVATALLQSSSASTVLMIGLADAGLLNVRQSAGLIVGAGIGGTITTQLLTVNLLAALSLPALGGGALLLLLARSRTARLTGMSLLGFGMIFFGFEVLKIGVTPWRDPIASWFSILARPGMLNLLASLGIGMAATVVLQSSAVTTAIAVELARQGILTDLPSGLALMIGCNVGTTATAVLASIGGTATARRIAGLHVTYRVLSGLVSLAAIPLYAWYFTHATADPLSRNLANYHTLHNTANALLFLPLTGLLVWLVTRLVPGRDELSPEPLFLDFSSRSAPAERFRQARQEILRLSILTRGMLADALDALQTRDDTRFESVLARERLVDVLHGTITQFILEGDGRGATGNELDPARLLQAAHNLERIGDHAENLVELGRHPGPAGAGMETALRTRALDAGRQLDQLLFDMHVALASEDPAGLAGLRTQREALQALLARLVAEARDGTRTGRFAPIEVAVFEDVLANLRSSASHALRALEAVTDAPTARSAAAR